MRKKISSGQERSLKLRLLLWCVVVLLDTAGYLFQMCWISFETHVWSWLSVLSVLYYTSLCCWPMSSVEIWYSWNKQVNKKNAQKIVTCKQVFLFMRGNRNAKFKSTFVVVAVTVCQSLTWEVSDEELAVLT